MHESAIKFYEPSNNLFLKNTDIIFLQAQRLINTIYRLCKVFAKVHALAIGSSFYFSLWQMLKETEPNCEKKENVIRQEFKFKMTIGHFK